ncbi:lactose-binding lectin l-2-like [Gigantopelta aegis]|uniref:lactose-binding lectin l-2-like n=1 Tax=Gigantopelta aegis TaxID=1735272 RepID=UPI001B887D66|nr:lactose-binding lectin l-2-like [Gigantopelta aegis]
MTLPSGRVIWTFFMILTLCCDTTTHKRQTYKTKYRQLQKEHRDLAQGLEKLSKRLDKLEEREQEAARCPVGFVQFYRRCLWFVFEPRKKWKDARQYCLNHSSRLVIDNSTRKHEFIVKFLKYNSPHGSTDLYTDGIFGCIGHHSPMNWNPGSGHSCNALQDWHWNFDGRQVSSSRETHWIEGHPPDPPTLGESGLGYGKVACLRISRNKATYGNWMAASCEIKLPFICELRLPKVVKTKKMKRGRRSDL